MVADPIILDPIILIIIIIAIIPLSFLANYKANNIVLAPHSTHYIENDCTKNHNNRDDCDASIFKY